MPIGHVFLTIKVPYKNFQMPRQDSYKPCEADVYCWENKHVPGLKNHLSIGQVTTHFYMPGDKIYMLQACGHALMSSLESCLPLRHQLNNEPQL